MTTEEAEMKITIHCGGLRRLCRKAGNAAFTASEMMSAAAERLKSRVEDEVLRLRLKREIRDVEEEIGLQMRAVGELIYATHQGTPSDSDDVREILEYVDGLREELAAHRRQLRALDGVLLCPACGAEDDGGSVYCRCCGRPLGRN